MVGFFNAKNGFFLIQELLVWFKVSLAPKTASGNENKFGGPAKTPPSKAKAPPPRA